MKNHIDEYEAMRNLNPATDKLGRDRDFQENTANSLQWATEKIQDMDQRIKILEAIVRSENEKMPNVQ
tara:strand:- start:1300 stop:1503 length:204 start_codon:yes stop_codon:yes gene_type:complete